MEGSMKIFAACGILALTASAIAQPSGTRYVAGEWNGNNVVWLDGGMNPLGQFPSGGSLPNGLAGDADYIYVGFFSPPSMNVFKHDGTLVVSWSHNDANLQGLEKVENELAISNADEIHFYDPLTGKFIRSIPSLGFSVEGLAYSPDTHTLFQLGGDGGDSAIFATDPANGNVLYKIPNPAEFSSFGGTGLTYAGGKELMVADSDGNWWRISEVDGAVQANGNNGVSTFGLGTIIPADSCYPDCDASGTLDIDDFICFQTFFALGDPYADCDGNGVLNIDDFICFQTFFAIGC
jgi:WD40 repeat protein